MNNLAEIINSNNIGTKITKIICPNPTHIGKLNAHVLCDGCQSIVCKLCITKSKEKCTMCEKSIFTIEPCPKCYQIEKKYMCQNCGEIYKIHIPNYCLGGGSSGIFRMGGFTCHKCCVKI